MTGRFEGFHSDPNQNGSSTPQAGPSANYPYPPQEREGSGLWFSTDLYRVTFRAGEDLEGVLAVRQEAGEVENYTTYALFNVTHPANWSLENVTISFRVSKEWLDGKNGTLVLLRYSGRKWEKYEPIYEYSDREYSYYRARVQGLSLFAVAEKIEVPTPPSPGTNETTETKPTTETTTTPNPTETPSSSPSPPNTESGSNLPYYALGIAVLILVGAYIYRKR